MMVRKAPPNQPDQIVTSLGRRRDAILETIRGASRRLSLSMFRCDDDEVLAELGSATRRGVVVEVLVTPRAKHGRRVLGKLRRALNRTGAIVHVHPDANVKYHAKYLVADGGPAVVSSLNFTRKCFDRTFDALVMTYDPRVVSGLRLLLAADKNGDPLPAPITERLIVGPERARRRIETLISAARTAVRIIDSKLSDPRVLELLEGCLARGVRVDVLDSRRLGDLKSHGKVMLIDDRVAVVGSMALAPKSLTVRREVAIIVDEPTAVAHLVESFESLAAGDADALGISRPYREGDAVAGGI
jgi:phosphatidylserine/phosphatidylglycerophosphate/cardiolipin synthase-like enzyme